MNLEQRLVNLVTKLLSFSAFLLYLFAVIQIGQISLNHPNFIQARDARGRVIVEDGVPKMIANNQPTIPDTIAIINTTIGAALALNFGAVIGISVTRAGASNAGVNQVPPPTPGAGGVQPYVNIDLDNLGQAARSTGQILTWIKDAIEGLIATILSIAQGLVGLHVRYWAVIVYLIALGVGIWFFHQDGGFNPDPGAIAVDLKDIFLTAVGIAGGIMSSLQKPT